MITYLVPGFGFAAALWSLMNAAVMSAPAATTRSTQGLHAAIVHRATVATLRDGFDVGEAPRRGLRARAVTAQRRR